MTLRPVYVILLAALAWPMTACLADAGPIAEGAAMIEQKLASGDTAGALTAASDLYDQVWAHSDAIGFTQALLVAEYATGYGIYNGRPTNVFKKGDPILIYCEPFGFGYGSAGAGIYSVNLVVDLQVLDASGNQMANAPQATEYNMTSRHKNREVPVNITYSLDGIQAGHYTLVTTLRDKNSARLGSFQTAIEIQ